MQKEFILATPEFQNITQNLTLDAIEVNTATFLTKNLAGAAVSIASGYTAQLLIIPASNVLPLLTQPVEVLPDFATQTFGATGLTIANVQAALQPYLTLARYTYALLISNDSFATQCTIASGSITVTNNGLQS